MVVQGARGGKSSVTVTSRVSDWEDETVLGENHLDGGGGHTSV